MIYAQMGRFDSGNFIIPKTTLCHSCRSAVSQSSHCFVVFMFQLFQIYIEKVAQNIFFQEIL